MPASHYGCKKKLSVSHTSSNRLLLINQDKGCTHSVAHALALPLGPALHNLWTTLLHKGNVRLYVELPTGNISLKINFVFI